MRIECGMRCGYFSMVPLLFSHFTTKTTEQVTDLYLTVVPSRYTSSKYRLLKEKKFYDKFVARQTLRVWSKEVAARRPALSADQQRLSKH